MVYRPRARRITYKRWLLGKNISASKVNRLRRKGLMKSMTSNYQVHTFKRATSLTYFSPVTGGGMNQSGIYPEGGNQYTWFLNQGFTLGALPNFTEFQNLFDQYMITGVKVSLFPIFNSFGSSQVAPSTPPKIEGCPYLTYAIDRDGTFPTTLSALNQYANAKTVLFNKPVHIYIKAPAFKDNVTSASGVALFQNKWIDTVNATVNHQGLVWSLTFPYDTNTEIMPCGAQVRVVYYLKMKNVR